MARRAEWMYLVATVAGDAISLYHAFPKGDSATLEQAYCTDLSLWRVEVGSLVVRGRYLLAPVRVHLTEFDRVLVFDWVTGREVYIGGPQLLRGLCVYGAADANAYAVVGEDLGHQLALFVMQAK